MIQIKDFTPNSSTLAGLKDPISFRFSELSSTKAVPGRPFTQADLTPPEGQHKLSSLSDIEATSILNRKTGSNIVYYNPSTSTTAVKNQIEVELPQATSDQVSSEIQRVSTIREQVRGILSYLARFHYPSDPIVDSQQKQAINYYDTIDNSITYSLANKGTVLDVYDATSTPDVAKLDDNAFSGFIQPTQPQLTYSRISYAANPGSAGSNNLITSIQWSSQGSGLYFVITVAQDLVALGVTENDNITIAGSIPNLNGTFIIQGISKTGKNTNITILVSVPGSLIKSGSNLKILDSKGSDTGQVLKDASQNPVQLDANNYLILSNLGSAQASLNLPKIIVANGTIFSTGSVLSLVIPSGSYNASQESIRDVIFGSVKQKYNIDNMQAVISIQPSSYSPLTNNVFFNKQELVGINGNGSTVDNKKQGRDVGKPLLLDLVLAVAGYPILINNKVSNLCYSLSEVRNLIEAEIPQTKLYQPLVSIQEFDYVGNLQQSSVCIYLHDDDKEIALVTNGKANPGAAVEFKLLTDSDKLYDVQTTVTLFASPVRIPITAPAFVGANAVQVGVKLTSNSSTASVNPSAIAKTLATSVIASPQSTPGEYYFYKTATVGGKQVNLNSYGTLRFQDKIKILKQEPNGEFTTVETNIIQGVVEKENLIVLNQQLSNNISLTKDTHYFIEIPQTPLNANRNYKVVILASDRGGNPV